MGVFLGDSCYTGGMKKRITKAIVPVAGWGTRRLPITKVVEKSMLPVGNRPLVDYSVQELIAAGVTDIYMVISNVEPCQVREFYGENLALNEYLRARGKNDRLELAKTLPEGVRIHYVTQDPSGKYGTAVPIALAVERFGIDEPVLVFMGDDFIWNPGGESAAEALIRASMEGGRGDGTQANAQDGKNSGSQRSAKKGGDVEIQAAILGVEVPREEVKKYGVLSVTEGSLTGVVEKPEPEVAPSNLINVSKYILTPEILQLTVQYVAEHDFRADEQEYLLTDPIDEFVKRGGVMRVARTGGEFLDGGSVEGWVHANNVVLNSKMSS